MINMIKLGFTPKACCWVHRRGQAQGILAMYEPFPGIVLPLCDTHDMFSSEQNSGTIRLYDGRGDGNPLETVEKLHRFPIHLMTVRLASLYLFLRSSPDTLR